MIDETAKIVVLDVETTGTEKATDQIIEICLRFGLGTDAEFRVWRIKPDAPIHPDAARVHGITTEALAECPAFAAASEEFLPLIVGADILVGYNVAFDLDMIASEISRAGKPPMSFAGKLLVDPLRLWTHFEPRTLVAAYKKFCGEELVDAHQAAADVAATARVLTSMLGAFGMADKPWSEIAAVSDPFAKRATWLGPSNHIQWDASGAVVFGFGKHKGQAVIDADRGFLRWMLAKDFPPHVMKICTVALERKSSFHVWIETYYPRPAAKDAEPSDDFAENSDTFDAPVQGVLL